MVRSLAGIAIVLGLTRCSLWAPTCGNRGIRTSIESDARESTSMWQSTTAKVLDLSKTSFALVDTVMTSESGNIRSCTGTMRVVIARNTVGVPIEYEVVRTDEGELKYRWEKDEFGKKLIAASLFDILAKATRSSSETDKSTGDRSKEGELSDVTAPNASNLSEAEWRQVVVKAIRSKMDARPSLPHGTQTIKFRVEIDGTISNVHTLGPMGKPELSKAAEEVIRSVGRVPPPPSHHSQTFTQKMTF